MSNAKLPERPSLEFLKKLAKDRLHQLRRADPKAKLATALFDIARDYGFSSWRSLKKHVEELSRNATSEFVDACRKGESGVVQQLLRADPTLTRLRDAHGSTALHAAAAHGHR